MIQVKVPRDNVNDETVVIVSFIETGSLVREGDLIVTLETSKTNVDIHAPCDGRVQHSLVERSEVAVGELLFEIIKNTLEDHQRLNNDVKKDLLSSNITYSKKALSLIKPDCSKINLGTSGWITSKVLESHHNHKSLNQNADVDLRRNRTYKNLIILNGGGGHAKMCLDILQAMDSYEIVGIVDSKLRTNTQVQGVPVIGPDNEEELLKLFKKGVKYAINAVGGIGTVTPRNSVYLKLKRIGFNIPNLIHPKAIVESSCVMGDGNQIMMGASVGSSVVIGNNCIVNSGSIISHDSILNSNCHVAPGAILAGSVEIGDSAIIGMGATVYASIKIGAKAVIYNGMNVFKDVPSSTLFRP